MAVVSPTTVEEALRASFADSHIEVEDTSHGCGLSVKITVVAASFEGQPPLARQKAVHAALGDQMKGLHSVELKCRTPSQWESDKAAASGGK
jgi:stress-induced morphogen